MSACLKQQSAKEESIIVSAVDFSKWQDYQYSKKPLAIIDRHNYHSMEQENCVQ